MDNTATLSPIVGQQADFTGLRAIVVDDCDDDRLLLTVMLEMQGIQVTAVSSAAVALSMLTQMQPDLLLSDLAMPLQDGYSLIRQVRSLETHRSLPAIAVSALSAAEEQPNCFAAGFQAYVTKPYETQKLATAIRSVLRQNRQTA
ncbi:MAG: response regulator [Microcoleus sp. SIO2G3]|nr:response regulator [Microcoleus sp. SIO2G3]